jgi:pimeloyl-ACP methyl ester carboxylesterase
MITHHLAIRWPISRRIIHLVVLAGLLGPIGVASMTASTHAAPQSESKPTIVLVHGGFADASCWNGVIDRLQRAGYPVLAPANPLRSLGYDATYIANVVNQIEGPVLLVGHSYGGAVITNAAAQAPNVVGLVYIAAFIPEVGESLMDIVATSADSLIGPAVRPATYPTGNGTETAPELTIDPARFHEVFAHDLPVETAAVMAVAQRPFAAASFSDKTGAAAWKTLPSWALVAVGDKAIGTSGLRAMAQRAGAQTVEVAGSHVVMITQPDATTDLILTAARSAPNTANASR